MNTEIRARIQKEGSQAINVYKNLILFVSIRAGKTKMVLDSLQAGQRVLVVYPFKPIKVSWQKDILKFPPKTTDIKFTTTKSLHKVEGEYDVIVYDEPHEYSPAELEKCHGLRAPSKIGLTGTLSKRKRKQVEEGLGLRVMFEYSLEDAIRDGLVKDYKIYVHLISMDNTVKDVEYEAYKKLQLGTEKEVYDYYCKTLAYFEKSKKDAIEAGDRNKIFLAGRGILKYTGLRTNFLYNSLTLYRTAKEIIKRSLDEKMLIYTLRTDIADDLTDKTFHSKNNDVEGFEAFKTAEKGHYGVVNCVSAGITIEKLKRVLFHAYESTTEKFAQKLGRSLLLDEEHDSRIDILALEGTQMTHWVMNACEILSQDKIFYVKNGVTLSKTQMLKNQYKGRELYYYEGKVVAFTEEKDTPYGRKKHYVFLGGDEAKEYTLPPDQLKAL